VNWRKLDTPFSGAIIESLRSSDAVLLSGALYVARDKAHERLCGMIARGESLPFPAEGQLIYYMGPSPAPPGKIIGAAGPTTSYRMDAFTEPLLRNGIKGVIGKGRRGADVKKMLQHHRAVYFATYGGAAAYLSKCIVQSDVIAFDDLGPEALLRLAVKDFPVLVVNDIYGGDLYEDAIRNGKRL